MAVITTETAAAIAADAIRKDGKPLGSGTRNYVNLCAPYLSSSSRKNRSGRDSGPAVFPVSTNASSLSYLLLASAIFQKRLLYVSLLSFLVHPLPTPVRDDTVF